MTGLLRTSSDLLLELNPALQIGGDYCEAKQRLEVFSPYSGELIGSVPEPSPEQIELILQSATKGFGTISQLSPFRRSQILERTGVLLLERAERFARLLTLEIGKPINQAFHEVKKAADTLKLCAEEALRIGGEIIPLSRQEANHRRQAYFSCQPLGLIMSITPFNFPIGTSCHKLGPAIAAGNATIYKPSPSAPLTGYNLVQLFYEAGLPPEALQIINCSNLQTEKLAQDTRIDLINFTGSSAVGWNLRRLSSPGTRSLFELGGNSPVIVHQDALMEKAIPACLRGAFAFSGQTCISVQRIYVHREIMSVFCQGLVEASEQLVVGDPQSQETDLGPLIKAEALSRIVFWVNEARDQGATILTGGKERGHQSYSPTVLTGVNPMLNLACSEIFGPVVSIFEYQDLESAIQSANDTSYGLSAGIFTQDLDLAHSTALKLKSGTVMVNDSSTFRADEMPIGGQNQSGLGIEGPHYAIREMSRRKLTCFNLS